MEIYKLNDEIPKVQGKKAESLGSEGKLKITELRQGVKNPNRVNVFLNGKFSFSLDVAQIVDLGIKVGREVSSEELADFKKASEFGKIYQRTLEWVLMRPRSVRETRDYLFRKFRASSSDTLLRARRHGAQSLNPLPVGRGLSSDNAQEFPIKDNAETYSGRLSKQEFSDFSERIIERLIKKGYVDDRKFAEFWVENRFVKKGVSRKRLRMELAKKGVAKEIIEEVLDGRNDEEEIQKIVAKKQGKYDDPEKLMAYLCRQGFSYDLVRKVVKGEEF